jgi:hypothetical protein
MRNRYDLVVRAEDNGSPVKAAAVAVTVLIGNELETSGEVVQVAMSQSSGVFPGHANPALIGFGADPDGDGWVNAFELLFGMNPDSPDAPGPMRILSESFLGENYMGYEFEVSAAFSDLIRFRGYGSSNLLTWAELTNAPAAVMESGGWRTYRIREDAATEETRFRVMRLGISPSEPVP